jgi:hypothetical protein
MTCRRIIFSGPFMTFADLGLSDELLRAVDDSGYARGDANVKEPAA